MPIDKRERVSYLSAIIQLAHAIGGVREWKENIESRERMLNAIYQSSLIINAGPDLKSQTRVFYWLAAWMNYHNVANQVTAEELWDNAWRSFDQ